MLKSSHTYPYFKLGDPKLIIKLLKDTGFDAYDFTMTHKTEEYNPVNFLGLSDYKEKAKELREYADKIGIICNQAHAPFPSVVVGNSVANEERFNEIARSIEIASILGAKYIIVHPWNNYSPFENSIFFKKLIPFAKKFNIKIALENMWNWSKDKNRAAEASCSMPKNYLEHLQLLPNDVFDACLDIGHAEMMEETSAVEMIYALNERLKCLHLHDNDKIHDSHATPFTMNIDFVKIANALKDVKYPGDLTLEVEQNSATIPICELPKKAKDNLEALNRLESLIINN